MAKVYIFTDENLASEYEGEAQEEFLSENFGDRVFLMCEDSKSFIMNEESDTVFIQEYFEN